MLYKVGELYFTGQDKVSIDHLYGICAFMEVRRVGNEN